MVFKSNKIIAILLILICLISNTQVYAIDDVNLEDFNSLDFSSLSSKQLENLKNQVSRMDDNQYDQFIFNIVNQTEDYEILQKNLKNINIELSNKKETIISTMAVPAYHASVNTYNSRRGDHNYETIHCDFSLNYGEIRPATYDVIVIYFDSTKANYYGYGVNSGVTSLKSAAKANQGTLVFNFYDDLYRQGYCTARIQNTTLNDIWYGVDFVHTYNTTATTTSGSASITFGGGGGVSGSIGVTVNTSIIEAQWSIADTGIWNP